MQKIKILQFVPYLPPHAGGLENFVEEFSEEFTSGGYGEVINITFSLRQEEYTSELSKDELIYNNNMAIGYKKDRYKVYTLPAFDLVFNFPFPKIWSRKFWIILSLLRDEIRSSPNNNIIQTHTRFFLSALLGGIFAKRYCIPWSHVEHGADYVKLGSTMKTKIAYLYDRIVGKWIFSSANHVIAISHACKDFIVQKFVEREVNVIYRGIHFSSMKNIKTGSIELLFIGRLVQLKGVHLLFEAYRTLLREFPTLPLVVIGDGDERESLEAYRNAHKLHTIQMIGYKGKPFIEDYLNTHNCIVVVPSLQEGLGTVVVEGLLSKNLVVASRVGGIPEISEKGDLILCNSEDINDLTAMLRIGRLEYSERAGLSYKDIYSKFSWTTSTREFYEQLLILTNKH